MATIKDIAQEAGVSTMMVSRVINKRYNQVSAENVARIEAIIQKHNYVPNSAARSLSSKASRIVAIFVQGDARELYRPYNAAMLGHLIQEVQAQGYDAMAYFIRDYSEVFDKLKSWRAAGAIFFGMYEQDLLQIQFNANIPLIFTDCYSDSHQFVNVGIDDYKGGVLAARHLLDFGHRNIAIAGEFVDISPLSQLRLKGFRDTLSLAGIELGRERIISAEAIDDSIQDFIRLKEDHLAVFALSDMLALRMIKLLTKQGYRVPEDFSIIGFDNLYVCTLAIPGLTTISQDVAQKARTAVDLLFQYIKYPDMPVQKVTLDVELVSRDTVKKLDEL